MGGFDVTVFDKLWRAIIGFEANFVNLQKVDSEHREQMKIINKTYWRFFYLKDGYHVLKLYNFRKS